MKINLPGDVNSSAKLVSDIGHMSGIGVPSWNYHWPFPILSTLKLLYCWLTVLQIYTTQFTLLKDNIKFNKKLYQDKKYHYALCIVALLQLQHTMIILEYVQIFWILWINFDEIGTCRLTKGSSWQTADRYGEIPQTDSVIWQVVRNIHKLPQSNFICL